MIPNVIETLFSPDNLKKILRGIGERFDELENKVQDQAMLIEVLNERLSLYEDKTDEINDELFDVVGDLDSNKDYVSDLQDKVRILESKVSELDDVCVEFHKDIKYLDDRIDDLEE